MTERDHDCAKLSAEIKSEAIKIFGNAKKANSWMTQKNLALGDTPLSMSHNEDGAREVRKVLSSIAKGGVV